MQTINEAKNNFLLEQNLTNNEIFVLINKFFSDKSNLFQNYEIYVNKIKKEIIEPLQSFYNSLFELYSDILSQLKENKNKVIEQKKILINHRENFYNLKENKNSTLGEIEKAEKKYKKSVSIANILYDKFNKEYDKIFEKNILIEERIGIVLKNVFKVAYEITNLFNKGYEENLKNLKSENSPFNNYVPKNDAELFKKDFNFYQKLNDKNNNLENKEEKKRLNPEIFISYEDFKNDYINYKKYKDTTKLSSEQIGFSLGTSTELLINTNFYNLFQKTYNKINLKLSGKTEEEKVDLFFKNIFDENEIDYNLIQDILSFVSRNDFKISKYFIINYVKLQKNKFFVFKNKKNFIVVSNIINIIINNNFNLGNIDNYSLVINSILILCERSMFENEYLCYLISNNSFFKVKEIWQKLIILRLIFKINKEIDKYKTNNEGILSSFQNYFLGNDIEEKIQKNKNNSKFLIYKYGLQELVESNYLNLTVKQKIDLNNKIPKILREILLYQIEHINNLNYPVSEAFNLIIELCSTKFFLSSEEINYYMKYINIASLSIRRKDNNIKKDINKNKILNIKNKNIEGINLSYPNNLERNKEKVLIINKILPYLNNNEKINYFVLNKEISKKIKFKFYYNLLKNRNISNETRINIWKSILNFNKFYEIKNKNLKDELLKLNDKNITTEINNIILDVKRTHSSKDLSKNEEFNNSIVNILISLNNKNKLDVNDENLNNKNIKYYQGINYLACFLYTLTKNENDSFNILYYLLSNTEFILIFKKEMKKLKNFFKIFERLLLLYLPNISFYFKNNSISVEYYLSPWVITLFSNVIQYHQSLPFIVINIWDEFLLKGWKSLMINLLTLISLHNDEILEKVGDELLSFLINDLSKSKIFSDENYEKWENEKKKFSVITNKNIKLLEEFFEIEEQLHFNENNVNKVNNNNEIKEKNIDDNNNNNNNEKKKENDENILNNDKNNMNDNNKENDDKKENNIINNNIDLDKNLNENKIENIEKDDKNNEINNEKKENLNENKNDSIKNDSINNEKNNTENDENLISKNNDENK